MDAPEIVVGLDIGTTKIACLVGRKTEHGKIEILGVGKAPSLGVHEELFPILKRQFNLSELQWKRQRQNRRRD